jgi:hypothetical protein
VAVSTTHPRFVDWRLERSRRSLWSGITFPLAVFALSAVGGGKKVKRRALVVHRWSQMSAIHQGKCAMSRIPRRALPELIDVFAAALAMHHVRARIALVISTTISLLLARRYALRPADRPTSGVKPSGASRDASPHASEASCGCVIRYVRPFVPSAITHASPSGDREWRFHARSSAGAGSWKGALRPR